MMHSTAAYTCRAPTNEVLDAMKKLSSGAFKLLMYYYSKSTGWDFDDVEIAEVLGVQVSRVVVLRKELVDKEYLLIEKGSNINNYFVGRKAVMDWKVPTYGID